MNKNTNLLKINGTTIPKLQKYQIDRNKLWKDAERNMSGDVRASLIGIFPKIEVDIGYLTENEMRTVTSLLDRAFLNVEYYDQRTLTTHNAKYYASDYAVELFCKKRGLYKPFTVSLIPVSRRSY